ncbi:MAG: ribonuclease P protein component [Selenomonadaceae bacterium]|nr:ribonuclease P protein component [Selenomonadaceae bacterium]
MTEVLAVGFTLPKKLILRRHSEFQRVYRLGKSIANRYLVLYILPDKENGGKVGFAAGKKLGGAVLRNRLKRLLRESYRKNRHRLKPGVQLILVARAAAAKEKCATVEAAFLELARRGGIFAADK